MRAVVELYDTLAKDCDFDAERGQAKMSMVESGWAAIAREERKISARLSAVVARMAAL